MADSNYELILMQLDELRSAVVQQSKHEKQLVRRVEELTAEVSRQQGIIAEYQRQTNLPPPSHPEARNGIAPTRHVKVRSIPAHSQSLQAYHLQRRSSTGSSEPQSNASTAGAQTSLSRSSSSHVPDSLSTEQMSSFNSTDGLDSGVSSIAGMSPSTEGPPDISKARSPSFSRSRDDSFSQRRPSSSAGGNSSRVSSQSPPEYTLSPDMEQKRSEKFIGEICSRYGGNLRTQRAARTIQRAYREHALKKMHAHHRQVRASRLFSAPPTIEQLKASGLKGASQHRWLSESKSAHRPPGRSTVSPATSLLSMASTNGESVDSIVGMSEMVVVLPEQQSADASLAGDVSLSSERSSLNGGSPSIGTDNESRDIVPDLTHSGMTSPASVTSPPPQQPGMDTGGQFEVMRRASFAVKPSDTKIKRQRQLRIGITHFNRKPGKGIQYLIAKKLLNDDAKAVAVFLKKQGGLSRNMVGDYLGNLQKAFNQSVLEEFVGLFNLGGEAFTPALRKFLSTFRLPGEAQKIEKILQVFADRYAECNPEYDLSADIVFVLAFSTIMLNTDLHNSSVKQHMTKEEFIRNNRGINDGEDIPREFLESIYDDVLEREFKTAKDHVQQVLALEKTIVGPCPRLAQPHRQLVHVARVTEVIDRDKKQPLNQHSRFLFLFNDMLLVAKYAPKKNGWTYVFKSSLPLLGMKVQEFSNQYYKRGFQVMTNYEGRVMMTFNGEKEETKRNFVRDMREVMAEIVDMEEERIQETERVVQRSKSSDLSPEVSRRQTQSLGTNNAPPTLLSQSVPKGPSPGLGPIMESGTGMKRSSYDPAAGPPSGSSTLPADRRSNVSMDVKSPDGDLLHSGEGFKAGRGSPSPSGTSSEAGSYNEKEANGVTGWRAKLYSGKKRKTTPHLP